VVQTVTTAAPATPEPPKNNCSCDAPPSEKQEKKTEEQMDREKLALLRYTFENYLQNNIFHKK